MSVSNVNNVSAWDMIPDEVKDIIIGYRMSYLHNLKYKNVLEDLTNHNYLKLKKFFERVEEDRVPGYLEIPLMDENLRRWAFYFCTNCNCCEKHQQNKPDWVEYVDGFTLEDLNVIKVENDCPCMCRQLCRDFCRFNAHNSFW